MKTKKVIKKITASNLFNRITFEQDNEKVTAIFKDATLTDGVMSELLKNFPPKKYDLKLSWDNGILQVTIKPTIFHYLGKIQPPFGHTWGPRSHTGAMYGRGSRPLHY